MISENLKKLIIVIIIIICYFCCVINEVYVLCESSPIQNICQGLKNEVYKDLLLLVKQQDFFLRYKSIFYENIILNKEFIKIYLEQLDIQKLVTKNIEKDSFYIKNEIINEFYIYIKQKEHEYERQFLKNILVIFYNKFPEHLEHIQQYMNFIQHADNVDISIRTVGFTQHMTQFQNIYIQKFIQQGVGIKFSLESDGVLFSISWYTVILFKKYVLLF